MGIDAECDSNTSYACTSSKNLCECQETNEADNVDGDDDERRLNALGYPQKLKRIFDGFCSFCLTASMMSILMGVIPLYSFGLRTGGAPVIFWSWAICGCMTLGLVLSLAEISSAYPTMGALYYWAYRLGGEDYGPFYSWMAGWSNLLGQIAGVSSGSYSGAQILSDILHLMSGSRVDPMGLMYLNILTLLMAGIVNIYAETLLTTVSCVSAIWGTVGVFIIVIWTVMSAHTLQDSSFVFLDEGYNNDTGWTSIPFVCMVGSLAAASTFTGYDTAAHVAEETQVSHSATPLSMIFSTINTLVVGLVLIAGMNYCVHDYESLLPNINDDMKQQGHEAYTLLWKQTVGKEVTILFLIIVFIAIEFSNCANLTSAARMVYSFSRDEALPWSEVWYHVDVHTGTPTRAIWFTIIVAYVLCLPGLWNSEALAALFSLTATGLYTSYIIPIVLRVTVAKDNFQPAEFNLGEYSIRLGWFSIMWGVFMIVILCLPPTYPVTVENFNYAPIILSITLLYAFAVWCFSAKHWFRGANVSNFNEIQSCKQYATLSYPPIEFTALTANSSGSARAETEIECRVSRV